MLCVCLRRCQWDKASDDVKDGVLRLVTKGNNAFGAVMSSGHDENPDEGSGDEAVALVRVIVRDNPVGLRESWLGSGATRIGVHAFVRVDRNQEKPNVAGIFVHIRDRKKAKSEFKIL
ncbi:hypothetical protein L1987_48831 [Smallanthus sonchifolius]|uniref:Uncharacterized protein n=1 Tax=Smallanthus sonchifolius TaxID=185202 RepID=A0ACB9FUP8_9ASTR|nr:hypothetical protein L1987_48831 [Smallanthus sonchifolius]